MMTRGSFVDISDRAIVSLVGRESLDLVQRISTNDVTKLETNGSIQTVLTNEKGRIVEVATVIDRGEEGLLLVGHAEDPQIMKQWIEKYIIMEDITLNVISDEFIQLMIFDATTNVRDTVRHLIPSECRMFEERLAPVQPTHVLAAKASREATIKGLSEAGFEQRGKQKFDEYRVLNGIPGFPNELSTSYNPLEAGLLHFVSFTKGCYIGQEVVARLDTYKKVQRRLVRLTMEDLPDELPEKVCHEGQDWGSVTSALRLSGTHECRGLGYLKTGFEAHGDNLYFLKGSEEIKLVVDSHGP